MPAEPQVLDALRPVLDPLLGRSIVELGMVVGSDRRRRTLVIELALPVEGWGGADELRRRVAAALVPVAGRDELRFEARTMSDDERATLRALLGPPRAAAKAGGGGGGPGGARLGHEDGRPNPFMAAGSKTRVLGISSGKGGVGKSSVTVNTAITLARRGYDVALLDADVYGFSVPKMLGITSDPTVIDDLIIPPVAFGVKVISMGFFVEEDQPVMWRGPMLHKALEQFLVDVHWGTPDFCLIDMPPGTGDVALSMAQYLPKSEVFVVTTPQAAAQRVAQRSAYMAKKVNLPLRGVIENMSWFTGDDAKRYQLFGEGGGAELAAALGVPLLGQVPLVPALREGGDVGLPVTVADPQGEAAQAFEAIADQLVAMGPARVFRSELRIS